MRGDPSYSSVPIPTYDEAVASQPSSQSFLGPSEVSNDAERQGLLANEDGGRQRFRGYQPPTVESARSSMDFLGQDVHSGRDSSDSLRREMSEMDILDPPSHGASQMSALISKRISSLTNGLSSLNIPFRNYFSSIKLSEIRLPPLPDELRPSWILFMRIMGLLLVLGIGYLLFFSDILHISSRGGYSFPIDQVSRHLQMHINASNIRHNLEHATKFDHIAGTKGSYYLAKWIEEEMREAKLEDVQLEQFDVYLNYPRPGGRSVSIVSPPELAFEAALEEEMAYTDPPREQTPVFHGYSKSGNASGPLVYANYGSAADFEKLQKLGVNVKGSIVLVRYYGTQADRGLKVKAAEEAGALGCIIYSDPQQDGFVVGSEYPEGHQRPKDGVQRGTVALSSWIVGDPLSPGFASLPGEKNRISKEDNPALVSIPSLPIAWRDAQHFLAALKGHGAKVPDASWIGGVPGVEWWTGDEKSPVVQLRNEQDEIERQPIYNVLGRLKGREQPEKTVVLGNHYDAWCFGATDPGSGTAVLVELIRIFGELRTLGWQPRRTIEFAAWDAEEYNLVGSTEHVEARLDALRRDGFGYINVDVGVSGTTLQANGSPLLETALMRSLNQVMDPASGSSLRALWDGHGRTLGPLGAGSDYVAFQDIAGTSAIDLTFGGRQLALYHSCYDHFDYMVRLGDPDFAYHVALAQVLGLVALELADEPLAPHDLGVYARHIGEGLAHLATDAPDLHLDALHAAQKSLDAAASRMHNYAEMWYQTVEGRGGFEVTPLFQDRMRYNTAVADFETNLLDLEHGLPGREQFRHILYAPALRDSYAGTMFPFVRDALVAGDMKRAQQAADRTAAVLAKAVDALPL